MVRIITDSAADFEPFELEKLNIACVPLKVMIADAEYEENVNLGKAQFYELLASTSGLGYLISIGRSLLRSDLIIVGILCLGMINIVLTAIFNLVEKRFVRGGKDE